MSEDACKTCKNQSIDSREEPCKNCDGIEFYEAIEVAVQPAEAKPANKYARPCKGTTIDVYDVLKAFEVTNPAIAHAVKKLLAPGKRGAKSWAQDINEAISSCRRGLEIGE